MLTEKDKDIILNNLIQSFYKTGYISGVYFNDCDELCDTEIQTSVTVDWDCDTIKFNGKEYNIFISTPDFCSYEDINEIPNEFDFSYVMGETYIEIYDSQNNMIEHYDDAEITVELCKLIFDKIKMLVEDYNKKIQNGGERL